MSATPSIVALIPARSGSNRVQGKNIRPLAGHPLLAYSIASALKSGIFSDIIISTDSPLYAEIAGHYGAEAPFLRPPNWREICPRILHGWLTPWKPWPHREEIMIASASCGQPVLSVWGAPSGGPGKLFSAKPGWIPCGQWKNVSSTPEKCGWSEAAACCRCYP